MQPVCELVFAGGPHDQAAELADGLFELAAGVPFVADDRLAAVEGPRLLREAGMDAIRAKSVRQTTRLIELADARGFAVAAPRDSALFVSVVRRSIMCAVTS